MEGVPRKACRRALRTVSRLQAHTVHHRAAGCGARAAPEPAATAARHASPPGGAGPDPRPDRRATTAPAGRATGRVPVNQASAGRRTGFHSTYFEVKLSFTIYLFSRIGPARTKVAFGEFRSSFSACARCLLCLHALQPRVLAEFRSRWRGLRGGRPWLWPSGRWLRLLVAFCHRYWLRIRLRRLCGLLRDSVGVVGRWPTCTVGRPR